LLLAALAATALLAPARSQEGEQDMSKLMAAAAKYTQPGEHHALLKRFLGEWDTETSFVMGDQRMPAEKGRMTGSWLMDGRWLRLEGSGKMMQRDLASFYVLGYDNFKQSYVCTTVTSMDTAMLRSEGDVDPRTGALILYGTLDEYLTGEHDKMVKYVFRFPDADTIVNEVHDLPIGESGTEVVEIVYKRRK
jgi:hypothetical protein